MAASTIAHEKRNWQIHLLYVRHEFDECLALIEAQLKENKLCEYPIYVKGERPRGERRGVCPASPSPSIPRSPTPPQPSSSGNRAKSKSPCSCSKWPLC